MLELRTRQRIEYVPNCKASALSTHLLHQSTASFCESIYWQYGFAGLESVHPRDLSLLPDTRDKEKRTITRGLGVICNLSAKTQSFLCSTLEGNN